MNSKSIFLLLTILGASLFAWPELNFQALLSQGDHGRDLYAFDAVTHGKLPYKDFWWVYGPFMPYYYGLWFKVFGVHITSVLLGRALLVVLCAVFFYLSAASLVRPGLAFLAATWFTEGRQEFFFTYNHVGGIVAELAICWFMLSYIKEQSIRYLWVALTVSFVLAFIKVNFGLAALAAIVLGTLLIDKSKGMAVDGQKKKFYICACLIIPAMIGAIYWLLLEDLPLYAIRQCMPYFGDDQPYHASPARVVPYYLMQHWLTLEHHVLNAMMPHGNFLLRLFAVLGVAGDVVLHGATLLAVYVLAFTKVERGYRQNVLLALAMIGIFFVFYFHEFLVSGVWYRQYWSAPFLALFHFVMIAVAFAFLPKVVRVIIMAVLSTIIAVGMIAHIGMIQSQKAPYRYLNMDRGHIYVGNEPQWTQTVNNVTAYLNSTIKKDDLFFALPYDCLYYYLTGKESPTRQLIFFDHIKIPTRQEISVIRELEGRHVQYILMSNRIISDEHGLGIFGRTYCPLLAQYILQNFTPIARQGAWGQPPGWANNHGVMIFKKK